MQQRTEIQDYFLKAPQPIKDYLAGDAFSDVMQKITTKYNFHINQAAQIENEMVMILLGLEHPNDLLGNLQPIGIPVSVVEDLIVDLDSQILRPMRDEIIRMYTERAAADEVPDKPKPTIPHSSLEDSVGKRLHETIQNPREEKTLSQSPDPYREPIE